MNLTDRAAPLAVPSEGPATAPPGPPALAGGLDGAPILSSPADAAFLDLADAVGDGVIEVDPAGAARALNASGLALLPLVGGVEGGPAPAVIFDALADSRGTGAASLQEVVTPGPGARRIRVAALVRGSRRLVVLRDATEERLLQERLLQSEKMASVGQLVSGVAHELNNPLTGVMGFAQLLLARDIDETSRAQVRTIYGEAERAAKIVQNLLSFARRRKPAKEMADVNALLAQVLELRSYDFAIRNISLEMDIDSRAPACWVDPDQVQQVFFNVVKNAEQAMIEARGGGRLAVTTLAMTERPGIEVVISDDGPGIPPEVARRIFDPFFTTKEAGQGTGLGLTISYGIIDEHGGRLWVEPSAAGGASFHIELPLGSPTRETREPAGGEPPREETREDGGRASYRVLVVDDEESIRLLLRDILTMDNHRVEVAASGIEAWAAAEREAFDVIITDMKMPGMDGATFYRELRQKDPGLASRIIFITGDTVSPDTRSFLQQVRNPVLSKPFKIGPLREAMESVLAGRAAAR